MKKSLSILLAFMIMMTAFMGLGFTASAEDANVLAVTIGDTTTNVKVGDTFRYTMTLTDVEIVNCQAVLNFDHNLVSINSADESDIDAYDAFLAESFPVVYDSVIYNGEVENEILFNCSRVKSYKFVGENTLATFEFTALAAGETTISTEMVEMAKAINDFYVDYTPTGSVLIKEYTSNEYMTYIPSEDPSSEEPSSEEPSSEEPSSEEPSSEEPSSEEPSSEEPSSEEPSSEEPSSEEPSSEEPSSEEPSSEEPSSEEPSSEEPSSEEPSSEEPSSEEPSEDPKPVKVNNVEADPTSTTVKFTWDLLDGATKYWVYQYNEANDTWSSVVSSYTDTAILKKLKGDTTYKFKVTARIGDNVYLNINDADLIEVTTDKAVATSSITAITGVTSADITWEPVEGATKYWVYKSTSESGPFYIYTSSLATTCTAKRLRPDTTYYFKIQALTFENGIDCYSDINDSPLLTVHTGSASIITTAAVENTATTATITWPAFENADKYWVLYSTTSADTNDRSHWTTLTSTTDTTYTFKNLQPNTVYYLNVCARYTDGGVVSTIDYIPVMVRTAYSNDDFITFTPVDDTHVTLTWDEGIEDVSKVWICAIDADGKEIGINSTTSNSITIRFADYKNYSYALKVVDSAGRIGYLTKTGGELYHE